MEFHFSSKLHNQDQCFGRENGEWLLKIYPTGINSNDKIDFSLICLNKSVKSFKATLDGLETLECFEATKDYGANCIFRGMYPKDKLKECINVKIIVNSVKYI